MAVSQKPKLIRITLDIKERARPLLQKMWRTVERHGNKSFINYSLTASLKVPKSSLDSFGLFMLLRRASSRLFFFFFMFVLIQIFGETFLISLYMLCFRYLELHPFEMISFRVVYVTACTPFPVFFGYCIILGICFLMV